MGNKPKTIVLVSDSRIFLQPIEDRIEYYKSTRKFNPSTEVICLTRCDEVAYCIAGKDNCIIVSDALIPGLPEGVNYDDELSGIRYLVKEVRKGASKIILYANNDLWRELQSVEFDFQINYLKPKAFEELMSVLVRYGC